VPAESVGDAIGITPGAAGVVGRKGGGLAFTPLEREVDGHRTTRWIVWAFVSQQETPPGRNASGEMESPIDGPARDGIVPAERIAA